MSRVGASGWVVLKFGGTSVSSPSNWASIAATARQRLDNGDRVLIVHSALSGVTDRLETLLNDAVAGDFTARDPDPAVGHRVTRCAGALVA